MWGFRPVGWAYNVAEVAVRTPINYARSQRLDTMSAEARACAKVAEECYTEPEDRSEHVETCDHQTLTLDQAFNEKMFAVYVVASGDPILGFTGTRFGTSHQDEDFDVDKGIAISESKNIASEMWIYEQVSKVAAKYEGKNLFVTGHSLGGTRGLAAAVSGNGTKPEMEVSHLIHEAHLFNPGSGLSPASSVADESECIVSVFWGESGVRGGDRIKCGIFVHRIFGDVISATNFPCRFGRKWSIITYSSPEWSKGLFGRHAIENFTKVDA